MWRCRRRGAIGQAYYSGTLELSPTGHGYNPLDAAGPVSRGMSLPGEAERTEARSLPTGPGSADGGGRCGKAQRRFVPGGQEAREGGRSVQFRQRRRFRGKGGQKRRPGQRVFQVGTPGLGQRITDRPAVSWRGGFRRALSKPEPSVSATRRRASCLASLPDARARARSGWPGQGSQVLQPARGSGPAPSPLSRQGGPIPGQVRRGSVEWSCTIHGGSKRGRHGAGFRHSFRQGRTLRCGSYLTHGSCRADQPPAAGQLAGAPVWSHGWATTLDPATVGSKRQPAFWHLPPPAIRISTILRWRTKMATATRRMTARHGTAIGLCSPRCQTAARLHRRCATSRQARPRRFPRHGRACRSSSTASAFNPIWTARPS